MPTPHPRMNPIAQYPAKSWILVAIAVIMIIAAVGNIRIDPLITITLQHPSTIAVQLRSLQNILPSVGALPTSADDIMYVSILIASTAGLAIQWWRNAKIGGQAMTLEEKHSWRPSTSENNFLSRNLAEPVADAPLCCARAPAHRHVAPRRPRSEFLTWQRLHCPKGSCIGKRGEGRWWVRSPANSRTSFSKRQKDYRKIGNGNLVPF